MLAGSGLVLGGGGGEKGKWPVILFEKPMQGMNYEKMGQELEKLGVQGIEATVRQGGHVSPQRAEEEIPKMVADLGKSGQRALIAATTIGRADAESEKLLRILKENGIARYRMDYFRYDHRKDLLSQQRDFVKRMKEMIAMNREVGIQGLYQAHSGAQYAGSMAWDLAFMLEGVKVEEMGVAFDLRHVRMDSGLSFDTALGLLKKHTGAIYVKDARWGGERTNQLVNVPLNQGFVDRGIFKKVMKGLEPVPISLHVEWGKNGAEVTEALQNFKSDWEVLRAWLEE